MNAIDTKAKRGKCLAFFAVLAVAFVVLAAVPAAVDDSYAETGTPDWTAGLTYFVGGENADDTAGDGSESKPFATVAGAASYFKTNAGENNTLTIELKSDVTGNGVVVGEGKLVNLRINFNGHTFNIDGTTVGSTGTETNGFQLLRVSGDTGISTSTVIFNGGTLTSSKALRIIQNYANLTLNDMQITQTTADDRSGVFPIAINNGTCAITGNTSITPASGHDAIHVGDYKNFKYQGKLTIDTTGVINGNVVVDNWNNDGKDVIADEDKACTLTVNKATINGDIVFINVSGAKLIVADGVNAKVVIPSTIEQPVKGSISFGDGTTNVISFDGIKTAGGLTFSKGSVVITGDFTTDSVGNITVTGDAKIEGDSTLDAGVTLTVVPGATLTINDGATFTNNGTIENEGDLKVEGTLNNEGTVINKDAGTSTGAGEITGNQPAEIKGGILTLNNYNGKFPFEGDIEQITLIGENTITIEDGAFAIKSTATLMKIKSIDGIGSLTIKMSASSDYTGTVTGIICKGLEINGVPVSITIDAGEDVASYGINADGDVQIYDSKVTVVVSESNYKNAYGFNVKNLDIKSATISVNAGFSGISAAGDVSIAASTVEVSASEEGINATQMIMITNASKVNADVFGLNEENLVGTFGVSAADLNVQTDSVLTTEGINITGTNGINNATIVNNGDFIIKSGAVFTNKGTLTNNGTIGVYGTLANSAGEIVNNGVINAYGKIVSDISMITFTSAEETTIDSLTIADPVPRADGTYVVTITATIKSDKVATVGYESIVFVGTLKIVNDAITIDAESTDGSTISISKGTIDYSILIDGVTGAEAELKVTGTFGPITDNANGIVSVTGGKITNAKTMSVAKLKIDNGEFANNGECTVSKSIEMNSGKLSGNDVIIINGVSITVSGEIDTGFAYSGEYDDTTSTPSKKVAFSDLIRVKGDVSGVTFTASDKGVFTITAIGATEKSGTVVVETGKAVIGDVTIGKNMTLSVSTGATLEVTKSKTVTATDGVIAVQDGATFNMKVNGKRDTYSFGTVDYTISFANDGYTYYGSLQFALANAAEGATLNLNSTATIDTSTVVKKGITLQFAENAGLTIIGTADSKTIVSMEEGAKFVLAKNATVTIGDNTTVSGTITYDGNTVVFDKIDVTASSTIGVVVSTKTTPSSIALTTSADAGTITASEGTVTGNITLIYNATDKSVAAFVVSTGAVAGAVVTDCEKSTITVDGTMNIDADKAFNGKITGTGKIVLKDGKTLTFNSKSVADVNVANADGTSSIDFETMTATKNGTETITVQSVAKTATKDAYLLLVGNLYKGTATVAGTVVTSADVQADAALVVSDAATLTIANNETIKAIGLVKVAGTINMKVADDTTTTNYGTLDYQITYTDGAYTVYTYLSTGVNNAKAGDSFTISKDLTIDNDMTVPAGVTIVIADGHKITLATGKHIIVGTAATTLGASTGISGKIVLEGNAFVVVYSDASVDMSSAKIVTMNGTTEAAAKDSQFSILENLYATVYIGPTPAGNNVTEVLVPEIEGYRFVEWKNVNDGTFDESDVGTIDFYAKMIASKVQVIFKQVDGIKYYVDGIAQNTVGAPVYVNFGAIITAASDYGYEGTPLVNGKAYVTVDSSISEIVGSGVTKSVAPVVEDKDDGMGLTDVLLIVLVVLIAVMAIIVALRMMRS